MHCIRIYILAALSIITLIPSKAQKTAEPLNVDYRYAPKWWQTAINLPESARKTLVGKNGQLMYEFPAPAGNSKFVPGAGFNTIISFQANENEVWKSQELLQPTIPLVITHKEFNDIIIREEAFAVAPLLFGAGDSSISDYLGNSILGKVNGHPGNDIVLITLENKGNTTATFSPLVKINSSYPVKVDTSRGKVWIADFLRVTIPHSIAETSAQTLKKANGGKSQGITILKFKPFQLEPGEKIQLAFGISHGYTAIDCPNNIEQALLLKKQSVNYWNKLSLPYNKIIVPDPDIQNILNASIRNIYQATDQDNRQIVLNTGATNSRQFLIADAPFIMDALTMLNQTEDVRKSLGYMLQQQRNNGSFTHQENDWKGTGYALWGITNYARLAGDKQWMESNWDYLEKGFTFLISERNNTLLNTKTAYSGLLPPGSGSEGQGIDYVHNYWALAGLNSAITAARWIGRNGQAIKWQSLYDDYYNAFQESVKKNMKKDAYKNSYLPARATSDKKTPPQKSQWSFLNAVYPGKIFDMNDPLLTGNMKMLEQSEKEGLLQNTGWINNSIVLATGSDYAHALQWTGRAQEAARVLYAMANHAAPTLAWYELQSFKESSDTIIAGDMPNSRISAEFIRMVRHLLVIERSNDLHLFEGVPVTWTKPGMEINLNEIPTDFGILSFKVKISDNGSNATIDMNLDSNNRRPPQRVILHLDGIAGNPATIELELKPNLHKVLKLE